MEIGAYIHIYAREYFCVVEIIAYIHIYAWEYFWVVEIGAYIYLRENIFLLHNCGL